MEEKENSVNGVGASNSENGTVEPGQEKEFSYVGEQTPNQVIIKNTNENRQANFIMQGVTNGEPGWSIYGIIDPGQTAFYWVNWPSGTVKFTNQGLFDSSIEVGGDGIFPKN
jgi:hypothetical protein